MRPGTLELHKVDRAVLAAGMAVAALAGAGALLLAWARSPFSGGEVALGVIAAFWFGGWVVVEPLALVVAYLLLRRRARISEVHGVNRASLLVWAVLVLAQYLALKATGDRVFLDFARRAFVPTHLVGAAVCGAAAISYRRGRLAFAATAICLVVLAAADEVSLRSRTWLPAWATLAATAIVFAVTAFRATRPPQSGAAGSRSPGAAEGPQ